MADDEEKMIEVIAKVMAALVEIAEAVGKIVAAQIEISPSRIKEVFVTSEGTNRKCDEMKRKTNAWLATLNKASAQGGTASRDVWRVGRHW